MNEKEETVLPIAFSDALDERYLSYALSTIMSRSLPDVRDGLKPVHRRLLYAMLQLKLQPEAGFKKCARVVGDVIGKYHPHGDSAVYDAMVRLAQGFAVRYPLVEGQGNFGSVDGDNAAAMRYTEAKLTEVAIALLEGINDNTVDFRPTYDGSEDEPVVLPAAFPNLLANGSEGIAVGMATSIPPHNAGELCDALLYLIKHPNASIEKLMEYVPGPDFPTGGLISENKDTILQAYSTGKGAVRCRAKWHKEDLDRGQYQIVITEIPYQVQKSRLIEKIADLFKERKLALLGDIRDESAEDIRIVLEPKSRTVDPEMLMASLFKLTELEARVSFNMNVLDGGVTPKVMNLREILQAFLNHRHEVLIRRTNYRLDKIAHRLEILEGLLIAYLNLDEIIRIIREEDEPKQVMMKQFKLTDVQAEAILNMRLRQLRKLEEIAIREEHDALSKEKAELEALLADESIQWSTIADQVKETRKKFGQTTELGERRTQFTDAPTAEVVSIEAFVEKEAVTVICSKQGWIRTQKGHNIKLDQVKFKEGDGPNFALHAYTTDPLLVFGTNGKCFTIPVGKLQGGKGFGEPIRLLVDMDQDADIARLKIAPEGSKLLLASSEGKGFIVNQADCVAQTKSGKQVMNVGKGAKLVQVRQVRGDYVAVIGNNRKLLLFPIDELPEMKKGAGVKLQSYKDAKLSDIKTFTKEEGLSWSLGERTRVETELLPWLGKRAQAGRLPPNGFPRNNKFE